MIVFRFCNLYFSIGLTPDFATASMNFADVPKIEIFSFSAKSKSESGEG